MERINVSRFYLLLLTTKSLLTFQYHLNPSKYLFIWNKGDCRFIKNRVIIRYTLRLVSLNNM
jgi:hypothetical protein